MAIVVASQADFDVRWCKGPVVERLFKPFTAKIESMGGHILSGRRVSQVQTSSHSTGARYALPLPNRENLKNKNKSKEIQSLRSSPGCQLEHQLLLNMPLRIALPKGLLA